MITPNNFRLGIVISLDNQLYSVINFIHVKPGKGGAYVKSKLKRLSDGIIIERTFRSDEKIQDVKLDNKSLQFLYKHDNFLCFMDPVSYELYELNQDILGDSINFLAEGTTITAIFHNGIPISVVLPPAVILKVASTEPGVKGDTATGATKPAILETGYVLQVPLFINSNDKIKVDTRSGEYLERA